jgi:eukaryotic-like serine/threonine-protein kinase
MSQSDSATIDRPSTKAAAERVGTLLNAKWTIDKLLGVGGMGAVFAATHRNNGSRAAVKVLHVEYAKVLDIRERFLREGRIANRVEHPCRVPVTDDDVSDMGEPFLVMELLEGMTLGDLFRKSKHKIPLENLLRIFDPVLDLLSRCHEVDIVHRDIKPANVFLTKDGPVRVLDFGVARMREPEAGVAATRAGIALGTASYIAPEQALGMERVDGRADLWSVGSCLYHGITGVRLHAAKSEAEEFVLAATQSIPSIARQAPDLPPAVVAFIDKALAYDRNHRFQSAAEMRTELLSLLTGLRTGQLHREQPKKQTGVVVRGNEIIEESAEATAEEKHRAAARMTNVFKLLSHAMASVRQYGFHHPQTRRGMQQAYAEIGTGLETDPLAIRWEVGAGAFLFEEQPVWEPDRIPFDRIPHQLFADGIRKVQFKPGLTEQELSDFVAILLRDVSGVFSSEDDSVTALWDRRFEHIAYLAVDSWAEGDGGDETATAERLAQQDELADKMLSFARIDKDWDDQSLESRAAEMNIASALREAGEAAAAHAVDPMTRATLGAQVTSSPLHFRECYVDAFVPAYVEAHRLGDVEQLVAALCEWTQDQVALHAPEQAFEMHQALAQGFAAQVDAETARAIEHQIAALMFPLETLRIIMTDFASDRRSTDGTAAPVPASLIMGLGRALELLASDAVFGLACECIDAGRSEPLRAVLWPYVEKWASGQEATIAQMLPRASEDTAIGFIQLLARQKTPAAFAGIEKALDNPSVRVRLAALAQFGESVGERAREEITKLLDSPNPVVRREVLSLIAQMNIVMAGPSLVRKIQADDYHGHPVEERRLLLEAVAGLKRDRAEELAVELLMKRKLLGSDSIEQTREMAADFLARSQSKEVLGVLETIAKQRWGTSASVREAAERAAAAVQEAIGAAARSPAAEGAKP